MLLRSHQDAAVFRNHLEQTTLCDVHGRTSGGLTPPVLFGSLVVSVIISFLTIQTESQTAVAACSSFVPFCWYFGEHPDAQNLILNFTSPTRCSKTAASR